MSHKILNGQLVLYAHWPHLQYGNALIHCAGKCLVARLNATKQPTPSSVLLHTLLTINSAFGCRLTLVIWAREEISLSQAFYVYLWEAKLVGKRN